MASQELTRHERGRLWIRMGIRAALAAGVIAFLALAAAPLLSLLMPFVLALGLAWLLNPLVRRLEQRLGASRKLLSLVLILLLLGVVGGAVGALGYNIVSELLALTENWQGIWSSAMSLWDSVGRWASRFFAHLPPEVEQTAGQAVESLMDWAQTTAAGFLNAAASGVGAFAMKLPSVAVGTVMFLMASYFISSDYPRLRQRFAGCFTGSTRVFLGQVRRTAAAGFGGYIRAQLILACVVFFILLVGFSLMGQPYAVLLAFVLAVLDFIPIVGSGTVMVPWAVICLITREFGTAAALMAVWGVIVIFRQVAEPRIVGNQTGLSPILSLLSIYTGMRLGGVWGMILGPVFCMVLVNIWKLGAFDGLLADLRTAAGDVSALLKNRPGAPEDGEKS